MDRSRSVERPFRTATNLDRMQGARTPEEAIRIAQIDQKANRLKELTNRQYEATWQKRTNAEVTRLRNAQGPGLHTGPKPPLGSVGPSLEVRAFREVQARQQRRLGTIDNIRQRMIDRGATVGAGRIADNRFGNKALR